MGMRVGLVDVDTESRGGKCTFPNLSLMKIAAWHRQQGDTVEWYSPLLSGHVDIVYLSKVFSDEYTKDYQFPIDADKVIRGGSGYAITVNADGQQVYDKTRDPSLPCEIEHIMPAYDIYEKYGITDTAYGSITRGCVRGCPFCHVAAMQGRKVYDYSPIRQFWNGQKNIVLLDPNITASRRCVEIFNELADTGAYVDFSQGLDARLLNLDKIQALNRVRFKTIHFAWDRPEEDVYPHLKLISENLNKCGRWHVSVYVLTNYGSTFDQDLDRVMKIRSLNMQPYVMIYRKDTAPKNVRALQRWTNMPALFWKYTSFEDYMEHNALDKSHEGTKQRIGDQKAGAEFLDSLFQ